MDMRLELIPLPSTEVARSIAFYVDQVGFHLDHDIEPGNGVEVSEVSDMGGGVSYAYLSDPDGNSWALQQISL